MMMVAGLGLPHFEQLWIPLTEGQSDWLVTGLIVIYPDSDWAATKTGASIPNWGRWGENG